MRIEKTDKILKEYFFEEEVPETLNFKLKNKLKEGSFMKKNNKFVLAAKCAGIVAACFICSVTALANSNAEICHAMENIPVIGAITKVVTFRTYEDKENNYTAYVEIPEIDNLGEVGEELNKEIQEYAGGIIKNYEDEKQANNGEEPMGFTDKIELTTGYDVITDDENYFSIKIWTNTVKAGTNMYNKYYTVDKKNNKIIKMDDLFATDFDYKTAVYNEIRSQMKVNSEKSDMLSYFDEEMGLSEITGNEKFYINSDEELVIAFDKYEVAPGYMGIQEFAVGKIGDGKLYKVID